MSDYEKKGTSPEPDAGKLEDVPIGDGILPDPDEGLSEEERAAIV